MQLKGKSTLIKLVVGALAAKKGKVTINGGAKIEYLAQHQLEQLDPDSNPMDTMLERYPKDMSNTHKGEIRRYLANFGLGGNELPLQKVHTMSGGQKCRLCLAAAMYRKPHLLILDGKSFLCYDHLICPIVILNECESLLNSFSRTDKSLGESFLSHNYFA